MGNEPVVVEPLKSTVKQNMEDIKENSHKSGENSYESGLHSVLDKFVLNPGPKFKYFLLT